MGRLQPLGSLSLPKAPNTSERGVGGPQHACSRCKVPTGGVSAIACPNDVGRVERERQERMQKEAERINAESAFATELEELYGKRN